jgi:hypothetical protein
MALYRQTPETLLVSVKERTKQPGMFRLIFRLVSINRNITKHHETSSICLAREISIHTVWERMWAESVDRGNVRGARV